MEYAQIKNFDNLITDKTLHTPRENFDPWMGTTGVDSIDDTHLYTYIDRRQDRYLSEFIVSSQRNVHENEHIRKMPPITKSKGWVTCCTTTLSPQSYRNHISLEPNSCT